jgi:hypothetical protein
MTVTEEEAYNYVNSNINSNINTIIDYTNKQSGNISVLKLTLIITIIIASIYLFYTFYINKKIST